MSSIQSDLLGREEEFTALNEHMSQAIQGGGRLVFVTGVTGVGKSHFMEEFKNHASGQGVKVLSGKCLYNESPIPYFPFTEALKQMDDSSEAEPGALDTDGSDAAAGMAGARFGMGMLGLSAADDSSVSDDSSLGFLPFGGGLDQETSIQKIDLSQERSRIFDEIYLTIEKIAEKEPLLLAIDDLQWADEATLQLLHYLARKIRTYRVLICCAYSEDEIVPTGGKEHPVTRMLERMSSERLFHRIRLKGLNREAIAHIIRQMLNMPDVPNAFIDNLYEQSEGNPFFVSEVVRSLQDEGIVGYIREGDVLERISVPRSVKDVIGRRLKRLDENTLKVLRQAALIGNEFNFEILTKVTGIDEFQLLDAIDKLLEEKILLEVEDNTADAEVYRFENIQIRTVLMDRLSGSRKRIMHKRIAEITEDYYKDNVDEVVYSLARDFYKGKDYQKACQYSLMSANKAMRLFAVEDAHQYLNSALDSMEKMGHPDEMRPERIELTMKVGDFSHVLGYWDEASEAYNKIIDMAREGEDEHVAIAHIKLGYAFQVRGMWDEANTNYEKGLEISQVAQNKHDIAESERGLGYIHWRLGEYTDALDHYKNALQNATEAQDRHTIAILYIEMGNVYNDLGSPEKAIEFYNKSIESLMEFEDYGEMSRAFNNLGDISMKMGEWQKAVGFFMECEETAKKIGRKDMIGWSLFNAGEAYANLGKLEEAKGNNRKALGILESIDDKIGISAVYKNYGIIYKYEKNWSESIINFDKGVEIIVELKIPYNLAEYLVEYGKMYIDKGDAAMAREKLERAKQIYGEIGSKQLMDKLDVMISQIGKPAPA
jgi:predicted ATPase